MTGFADTFLNMPVIVRSLPAVVSGFVLTVELAVLVVATGLAAGLLLAVARTFGSRPLNLLIVFLVDLFRALPPLVIILLVYFGAPAFDATPSGFLCTWISLSLVLMAFAEEIYWAGITAVPRGQWEAARSTGLGFAAALCHVVLPQALRITVPPLTNRTIAITKGTALGSVVAVSETPVAGVLCHVVQRQSIAVAAWCRGIPGAVPADGGGRPLGGTALAATPG